MIYRFDFIAKSIKHAVLGLTLSMVGAPVVPLLAQDMSKPPIAYIGHGAMFDRDGNEVAPTAAFLKEAQAWYLNDLKSRLSKDQALAFEKVSRDLVAGLKLDEQSQLVVNAHLLDWLVKTVQPDYGNRLYGINALSRNLLKSPLPKTAEVGFARNLESLKIDPDIEKRLLDFSKNLKNAPSGNITVKKLVINKGGQAYIDECANAGVPVPPPFGPGSPWVDRGAIPQSELFIAAGLQAKVLTYVSSSPAGMCVALPRHDGTNVQLDGIICFGKVSSKVCFWDNEKDTVVHTFPLNLSSLLPILPTFGGGSDLVGDINQGGGGFCSDCHSGENPYVIHGATLNSLAAVPLPTFPDNWPEPIVRGDDPTGTWPQNPGPMSSTSATSVVPPQCGGCHDVGSAGRFPHLSTSLPGYCGTVLTLSINKTMPPSNPGGLKNDPAIVAFKNWCGVASTGNTSDRGDPHLTTANNVPYGFQSAGEFVALRGETETEIQTRQTPISSAPPFADPHTDLTSCVSLNTAVAARVGRHRVTYEPEFKPNPERPQRMILRVDGRETILPASGLGLGNGGAVFPAAPGAQGITVAFPDKTQMAVTSMYWAAYKAPFLNVDITNSPARVGIMGTVLPGNWLPGLPGGASMGPKPASMSQRYTDLNQKFADAWRVSNSSSLFDYEPGTSTADFTDKSWPPEKPPCVVTKSAFKPLPPIELPKAEAICGRIKDKEMLSQCAFDVAVTGDPVFAKAYLASQTALARLLHPRPGQKIPVKMLAVPN